MTIKKKGAGYCEQKNGICRRVYPLAAPVFRWWGCPCVNLRAWGRGWQHRKPGHVEEGQLLGRRPLPGLGAGPPRPAARQPGGRRQPRGSRRPSAGRRMGGGGWQDCCMEWTHCKTRAPLKDPAGGVASLLKYGRLPFSNPPSPLPKDKIHYCPSTRKIKKNRVVGESEAGGKSCWLAGPTPLGWA